MKTCCTCGKEYPATPDNVIPLCQSCNSSKRDNKPHLWLVDQFSEAGISLYNMVTDYLRVQ